MSQQSNQIKQTPYGRIFRHTNGIIYIYWRDNKSFTIHDARQIVADSRALDDSGRARLLVVQGINNDLSFEAQRYLGTVEGLTHLALVVQNKLQADVAQFFLALLKLFHSPYELRVFYRLKEAEAWLLSGSTLTLSPKATEKKEVSEN